MSNKIEESSGVSFSLSFLIQILSAIETKMAEAQDAPISSDYIQNTSLRFIEERIAIHQAELDRLEEKIYQISLTINK